MLISCFKVLIKNHINIKHQFMKRANPNPNPNPNPFQLPFAKTSSVRDFYIYFDTAALHLI